METFFAHKDAYPVLGILVSGLTVAIIFVAHYWHKVRRAELELSLKQTMVERGMTAEEICAVVESGHSGKPDPEIRIGSRGNESYKVKVNS
jgi:hypothetical protein